MNPALGRLVFTIGDRLGRDPIIPVLQELQRTEHLPEPELRQLTWRRLSDLLGYASAHVPYYRRVLKGIPLADIKALDDLQALPILTKADVQTHADELLPDGWRPRSNPDGTSGSTGQPLKFQIDTAARAHFLAAKLRGESWYGVSFGDPVARVWSVPLLRYPRLREQFKDISLNRVRLSLFDMTDATMAAFIRRCQRFRPRLLYGYASSVARLAHFVVQNNLSGSLPSLRAVATTCETLFDYQREVIRKAFGVPVASEYGCTEVGVIAYQCPMGSFHIASENVIVEILRDGRPVPPGETGTVVVTGLHNRSTPFIRYEVGDYGSLSPEPCPCGRTLPVMGPMLGRTVESLVMHDGRYLPAWIFDYAIRKVNAGGAAVNEFRVVQTAIDCFRVDVVPGREYSNRAETSLRHELEHHLGKTVQIQIQVVGSLPRTSSGKLRYFVSELPNATASAKSLIDQPGERG